MSTEKRPWEEAAGRHLSASQEERPHQKLDGQKKELNRKAVETEALVKPQGSLESEGSLGIMQKAQSFLLYHPVLGRGLPGGAV